MGRMVTKCIFHTISVTLRGRRYLEKTMAFGLKKLVLVASLMVTGIAVSSQAAANGVTLGFDTSFGSGGVVTHSLPFGLSSTESIDGFIDASGRLVSLVNFNVSESDIEEVRTGFVLARHTAQGQLDTTFGVDGMTPPVSATISTALVVLPNGNIVVSGMGFFGGMSLHAFTSDGEVVNSFGVNGRVAIQTQQNFDFEEGDFLLNVQGNKLIASTRSDAPSATNLTTFIRSFTFDGGIEPSFGTQGVVNLQTNAVQNFALIDTEVTNDGRMLLMGNAMLPPTQEQIDNQSPAMFAAVVIRLTSNGSIDTSFADYGLNVPGYLVIPPSGTAFIEGMRIAVSKTEVPADLAFGKFIVSGQTSSPNGESIFFSRFMANGMPDTGFGTSGTLMTDISAANNSAFVFDMHLAANGELKAALIEVTGSPGQPVVAVLAISANGNASGQSNLQLGAGSVVSVARILPELDETFVVLASTDVNQLANVYVRISAAGQQDPDYGNDQGLANVDIEYNATHIGWTAAFKADNGYTYLGGLTSGLGTDGDAATSWLVVRLTLTGSIDPTFGVDGYASINNMPNGDVRKINVTPDGKVYVLGIEQRGLNGTLAGLGRLNANGSIDTTFGGDNSGSVPVAEGMRIDFNPMQSPIDMIVQHDKRVVVVGTIDNDNRVAFMQRFNEDGTLDTSFDGVGGSDNGFVRFTFAGDRGFNLVQQHLSGGYLVAGQENGVPFIGRITTSGVFDASFEVPASPGMRPIETSDEFGALRNGEVSSMAQMSDGTIVVAGWLAMTEAPGMQKFLARFDSNGVYATGFDGPSGTSDGLVVLGADPLRQEVITGLMLLSDGSMVLAGSRAQLDGMEIPEQTGFFLFATSDGRIDTATGDNGYLIVGDSSNMSGFFSLISTGDNEWIGVGLSGDFLRLNGIVARIMLSGTPVVPAVPPIVDAPDVVPVVVAPVVVAPVADVAPVVAPVADVAPVSALVVAPVVAVTTPVKAVPKLVKPVVLRKKSVTRTALMKYMKLTMPKGSKVTITVSPKSKRFCKLSKTRIVYVRPGKCLVRVTVRPKKGIMRSATTTMLVKR